MTPDLQSATAWRLKPEIVARAVGSEMVLLDLGTGLYHRLNPVAAVIYDRLQDGASFDDLVGALTAEFDVEDEAARADVAAFLQAEAADGLLLGS